MITISHDADFGTWVADMQFAIARERNRKRHHLNTSPPAVGLRRDRPGEIWTAVRTAYPEFMSAIEHLQARSIPVRLETAELLIAHLLEAASAGQT